MHVYLSEYIAPSARKRLEEACTIVDTFDHPELLDGIIVRRAHVTREIIEQAPRLKIISMHGVGLDTIDVEAAREYGVQVTNVPCASSESVAELAVSYLLACARKLKLADQGLGEGRFHHFGDARLIGHEVAGKKVGLIGSGHIARRVAAIMKLAFGCEIFCYNGHRSREELAALGMKKADTLETLFSTCDMVSIHVPLTEETRNMIDSDVLSHANKHLILVNTSRGGIVDEGALYEALTHHAIAAAGLDVFEEEVPDKENPLLHLDNCLCSLHVGGSTEEALERVSNEAVDHLLMAFQGENVPDVRGVREEPGDVLVPAFSI